MTGTTRAGLAAPMWQHRARQGAADLTGTECGSGQWPGSRERPGDGLRGQVPPLGRAGGSGGAGVQRGDAERDGVRGRAGLRNKALLKLLDRRCADARRFFPRASTSIPARRPASLPTPLAFAPEGRTASSSASGSASAAASVPPARGPPVPSDAPVGRDSGLRAIHSVSIAADLF